MYITAVKVVLALIVLTTGAHAVVQSEAVRQPWPINYVLELAVAVLVGIIAWLLRQAFKDQAKRIADLEERERKGIMRIARLEERSRLEE